MTWMIARRRKIRIIIIIEIVLLQINEITFDILISYYFEINEIGE